MRRALPASLSALAIAATACIARTAVVVMPLPDTGTPVFEIRDATGRGVMPSLYGLSVLPCESDVPVWTIAASGERAAPRSVTYGRAPAGYVTHAGPAPLTAGCYRVYVTGGGSTRFTVDSAGRAIAR